jgi:hypothetical protein
LYILRPPFAMFVPRDSPIMQILAVKVSKDVVERHFMTEAECNPRERAPSWRSSSNGSCKDPQTDGSGFVEFVDDRQLVRPAR